MHYVKWTNFELPKLNGATQDFDYTKFDNDTKLILSAFDTDNKKGVLSREEIGNALNNLRVWENEYCVYEDSSKGNGFKKGDGLMDIADFKKVIENDKKFENVKSQLSNIKDSAHKGLRVLLGIIAGLNSNVLQNNSYEFPVIIDGEAIGVCHESPVDWTTQRDYLRLEWSQKEGECYLPRKTYGLQNNGERYNNPDKLVDKIQEFNKTTENGWFSKATKYSTLYRNLEFGNRSYKLDEVFYKWDNTGSEFREDNYKTVKNVGNR